MYDQKFVVPGTSCHQSALAAQVPWTMIVVSAMTGT